MKLKAGVTILLLLWIPSLLLRSGPPSGATVQAAEGRVRRVNAPYFSRDVTYAEMGLFWFGRVDTTSNYADVRVGYDQEALHVRVAVFDRWLWYDRSPTSYSLDAWDAVSLYLNLDGNVGQTPDPDAYRFVGQLNWWEEDRAVFQTAYRGNGSGWSGAATPFSTSSGWRGNAPNDNNADDRGWVLTFRLPFASLGCSGPPAEGAIWGLGAVLHDRDDAGGTAIADQTWPETLDDDRPATWGQLRFGLPTYSPPSATIGGSVTIREKLNGAVVPDAAVGGTIGNLCPGDADYIWNDWGDDNFGGGQIVNIQNQGDVADWPCFAKYYVTFPLDTVPAGRSIISAKLTLHQSGNAGGGSWGEPDPSLIQVFTIDDAWSESALTWNNAPLAGENGAAAWVDPLPSFPGWPGVPTDWDVSREVAQAYEAGEPLRLALYSADTAYHSGKYFVSSETGDWNAEARPTLTVTWGEPAAVIHNTVRPSTAQQGQAVTYTLSLQGNGQPLAVLDTLPPQVSAPQSIEVLGGAGVNYEPGGHRLTWSGAPGSGESVIIQFHVNVQVSGTQAVANTATLTDGEGNVSSDTAVLIVDPRSVYLPLALR